jgi:RNA polymerase sigma-70 factor, ECF subfamily
MNGRATHTNGAMGVVFDTGDRAAIEWWRREAGFPRLAGPTTVRGEMDLPVPTRPGRELDADSREWVRRLSGTGVERDAAVGRLHGVLLRAARFEVARRRATLPHLRGGDLDDIANQAADDALVSVLARLDSFRGDSRFTTWAYKFALLEAAVKLRRRSWQGREVPVETEAWERFSSAQQGPSARAEQNELLGEVWRAVADVLTPHQRRVLVALAVDGVPIDVLADRLGTTRGALYKTLHDARRKVRRHLHEKGLPIAVPGDR